MFKCAKNNLWFENPLNLVCNADLVPLEGMTYAEQMNSITRLVILIFIVMILVGFNNSFFFLVLLFFLVLISLFF